MPYALKISDSAIDKLRSLPKALRRQIGQKLDSLERDFQGDVKKLVGHKNRYRLRVGSYRVLFALESGRILVYGVTDRKDAYE